MPNLALLALEASDGTVVLTSITLVFAMLVALCLIITLEGKIFDNINNKKNGKPAAPKAPAAKAAPAPAAKPAAPAAKADNGSIPGEIIAAISAAVATVCGGNAVIRGIKRVSKPAAGSRRGAWGDAGVREHTDALYVRRYGNGCYFYQYCRDFCKVRLGTDLLHRGRLEVRRHAGSGLRAAVSGHRQAV